MSTRLEQAERDYQDGKLHINKYHEIIIAERNKEVLGLQQRLRETQERLQQAAHELEVCRAVTTLCCEKPSAAPEAALIAEIRAWLDNKMYQDSEESWDHGYFQAKSEARILFDKLLSSDERLPRVAKI